MYENVTFDVILQRMLDRVPDTLDKREGSIIYDALAPAAVELQIAYLQLDNILNESFADTATREYLIKRAAERGISPYPASAAVLKGEFSGAAVPAGTRFSLEDLNYIVTEAIDDTHSKLRCETPGICGNQYLGTLIPIDYVKGLESAKLTEILVPGEDEEDTEIFRKRYFDSLNVKAFGGNITDYIEKVGAVSGVGGVKVLPTWDGPGTVKVIFTTSQNAVPSAELVQEVQQMLDPVDSHAKGVGLAPIGHSVTVQGAADFTVNVAASITCAVGHVWTDIQSGVTAAAKDYLAELAAKWADGNIMVRVSQIESKILDVAGVLDVEGLTLNGTAANLPVPEDKIPVLGAVTNNAAS
ncbi:MAG TPA: phage tail protein [Ruminococcaceae bacterium]|jgi:uncharacterized phage protein gp47/JayE|nr:phage tail protein [Oscillospiraceae bacterium]